VLCQLIYTSDIRGLGSWTATALLDQALRRNAADSVTGMLLVNHRHVVQCLEGPTDAVFATFERIAADPRHCRVTPTSLRLVEERSFPDWGMAFVGVDQTVRGPLRPFLAEQGFTPRTMTADALHELMIGARQLTSTG
jgi:hypothetical protein